MSPGPSKGPPRGPPTSRPTKVPDEEESEVKESGPPSGPPSSGPPGGPPSSGPPSSGPPRGPPSFGPPSSGPPQGPPSTGPPKGPPSSGPPSSGPSRGPPSSKPPMKAPPVSSFSVKEEEFDEEEFDEEESDEEEFDEEEFDEEESNEQEFDDESENNPIIVDKFGTDNRKPMEIKVESLDALPNRVPLSESEPDEAPPDVLIQPREVLAPAGSVYDDLPDTERSGHIVPFALWPRTAVRSIASNRHLLLDMFDDLLTLLESNEDTFPSFDLDGQTLMLEEYLIQRPENRERVKSLVSEGRLNIGPWYNPPSQFLVGGEALVRNLQRGVAATKSFGGTIGSTVMPRSTSHVSQLPTLLSEIGSDELIFNGGAGPWIQDARGIFKWSSSDGDSSILAIKQIPSGDSLGGWGFEKRETDSKNSMDVDSETASNRIETLSNLHLEKYGWLPPMMLFGNGTRHGMAQPSLPSLIADANKAMEGEVTFSHSSFSKFGKEIRAWVGRKKLYSYDGEMRHGWDRMLHSGAISSRIYLKRMNDHTIRTITHSTEPLAALSWFHKGRNRWDRIQNAWDLVLQNHGFHEIGGVSPDEVHMDMEDSFRHAQETAAMVTEDVRIELADEMNLHHIDRDAIPMLLHNPLGTEWSGMLPVDIVAPAYRCWLDAGNPVHLEFSKPPKNSIIISDLIQVSPEIDTHLHRDSHVELELPRIRGRVQIHRLPPGIHVLHAVPGHATSSTLPSKPVEVEQGGGRISALDNGEIRVEFLPDGRFDLVDRSTGRRFPGIGRLEDVEDAGDSYDHSPAGHPGKSKGPMDLRTQPIDRRLHDSDITRIQTTTNLQHSDEWSATVHLRVVWNIPAYLDTLNQTRSVELASVTVDHFVTLRLGARNIEVETWVDNKAEDHRLRLIIPTGMHLTNANVGTPFDVVRRPVLHPHDPSWVQPLVPTQPMERFLAVIGTEDGLNDGGLALLSPGVNEYEIILADDADPGGHDIALTLVRSTGWTSQSGFSHRPTNADAVLPAPGSQCIGTSITRWSVLPFDEDWQSENIHHAAECFATSANLLVATRKPLANGFFEESLTPGTLGRSLQHIRFDGEGPTPVLSAFKPSEDLGAIILRVYNPTDTDWKGRIYSDLDLERVHECSMLENARKKKLDMKNGGWDAEVKSGSIVQWRLS